tara:strand:- start:1535 stop:2014 length:480 start_codon:yes stop_codon:yes gene_type:complete
MKILSKADGIKKVKSMQKTGGARIYKVKKVKTNVRGKNITMYNLFTKNTRHSSMSNPYGLEMMRYGGDKAAYLIPVNEDLDKKNIKVEVKIGRYDIGMGSKGNGITLWNRNVEKSGDYKSIAHIDNNGKITNYEKRQPKEVTAFIQKIAKGMKDKPKGV